MTPRAPSHKPAGSPDPAHPLALERNLALMAGAGAGKTYSLITICLHLLGGGRRDGVALKPADLFLLTFTEKAAGEMRQRLRARVDRLAREPAALEEEEVLRASYQRWGRPPPPQDFWRRLRDDLGAATIGTFHSLCVQLLRRAPAGFGVDPAFELLEERDARALIADCAERVVLEALSREEDGVAELCRDMGYQGQGRAKGLVDALCHVFGRVREEGLAPGRLPVSDPGAARAAFDQAVAHLRDAVEEAAAEDAQHPRRFGEVFARARQALSGMTFDNFLQPGRWPLLRPTVEAAKTLSRYGPAIKQVRYLTLGRKEDRTVGLDGHYAACLAASQERAFRKLLCELRSRHRAELDKRAVLDFSELLIRTRDLLRDAPTVRREVQDRVKALLVDEFQDTNRLQWELVTLLAEQREGAPRLIWDGAEDPAPLGDAQLGLGLDGRRGRGVQVEDVPLEPGMLAAVGDRKQSIYEFRGADVSVFELLARQIERDGGGRSFLQDNRRSSPELLGFFNAVFARVMARGPDPRDYEVAYTPEEDDLRPVRSQRVPAPVVERLVYPVAELAEDNRRLDAETVARRLRALLAPDAPKVVVERDVPRQARGGDVALLFRRFTHLEVYRQALIRHGVPHRVVRGRGFYGAQEVLDLASLLCLLADPSDGLSLAAVLRSPLVALSDAALFRVAWQSGQRLSLKGLSRPEALEGLGDGERASLDRFVKLYDRLVKERDRLGLRVLLQVALEETGFRASVAGTPFGEQALANVDKLLELAGRRDARGGGDCAGFAQELVALAEAEPTEAQADVLDVSDPRAVQLLTIHRAKGLEWPVVVVPDLVAGGQADSGRVLFDRGLGLSVQPVLPDEASPTPTPRHRAVGAELGRRHDAEGRRILYVALTRARDWLLLSGQAKRPTGYRKMLDALLEDDPALRARVRDVHLDSLPEVQPPPPAPAPAPGQAEARVEKALQRARTPPVLGQREVVLPVTQLQDFFLCPRRYLYAHEVGLSEHPMVFEREEDPDKDGDAAVRPGADPRLRGTLAHRLLERADLEVAKEGGVALRSHLEALLSEEGHGPAAAGSAEILDQVEAFFQTRLGREVAKGGAARAHRELPFLLRIGEGDGLRLYLKGTIDLLWEDEEGGALVLDYKFSRRHPAGLAPYAFQLECYALAARQYVKEGVPVRAGIAFLRDGKKEPELLPARDLDEAALSARLQDGAKRLLAASRGLDWPGQQKAHCEAIKCGYQYRCHPPATRRAGEDG